MDICLFGQEICKNGFCLNTQPGYECYCKQGTYYDPVKLQCFDCFFTEFGWFCFYTDECQDPNSCIDGQCINTEGSYNCFCTHPMVLDATEKRYDVILSSPSEQTEETEVYQDLCWQHLSDDFVCSRPLVGKQTTYTECCCLYGEAWGMQCALCPMKESGKEMNFGCDFLTKCLSVIWFKVHRKAYQSTNGTLFLSAWVLCF
uniref:TB domain-containing protein n=1 Tax=Pavo cristatus TaxID=9049 RepID=A0A8C9FJ93_PAVCR